MLSGRWKMNIGADPKTTTCSKGKSDGSTRTHQKSLPKLPHIPQKTRSKIIVHVNDWSHEWCLNVGFQYRIEDAVLRVPGICLANPSLTYATMRAWKAISTRTRGDSRLRIHAGMSRIALHLFQIFEMRRTGGKNISSEYILSAMQTQQQWLGQGHNHEPPIGVWASPSIKYHQHHPNDEN